MSSSACSFPLPLGQQGLAGLGWLSEEQVVTSFCGLFHSPLKYELLDATPWAATPNLSLTTCLEENVWFPTVISWGNVIILKVVACHNLPNMSGPWLFLLHGIVTEMCLSRHKFPLLPKDDLCPVQVWGGGRKRTDLVSIGPAAAVPQAAVPLGWSRENTVCEGQNERSGLPRQFA